MLKRLLILSNTESHQIINSLSYVLRVLTRFVPSANSLALERSLTSRTRWLTHLAKSIASIARNRTHIHPGTTTLHHNQNLREMELLCLNNFQPVQGHIRNLVYQTLKCLLHALLFLYLHIISLRIAIILIPLHIPTYGNIPAMNPTAVV